MAAARKGGEGADDLERPLGRRAVVGGAAGDRAAHDRSHLLRRGIEAVVDSEAAS